MTAPIGVAPLFPLEIEEILLHDFEHAAHRLRWVPFDKVVAAILALVDRHGQFPVDDVSSSQIADVLIGPQIRRLDRNKYVVANCGLFAGTRQFEMAHEAAAAYCRSELSTPHGANRRA